MNLRLASAGPNPTAAFEPDAFNLAIQPTRPGTAHFELVVEVSRSLVEDVRQRAAQEGLKPETWAGLVIESERALRLVASPRGQLLEHLNACACRPKVATPGGAKRLTEFARALRLAPGHSPALVRTLQSAAGRLLVLAPYCSMTSWRWAAIDANLSLEEWVTAMLAEVPTGRPLWEAAAAERGETLAEWILAQAARR